MEGYLAQVRPLRRLRQEPIRGFRLLEGNHCQTSRLEGTKVPGERAVIVGCLENLLLAVARTPLGPVLEEFSVASHLPENPRFVGVALGYPARVLLSGIEAGVDHARHE